MLDRDLSAGGRRGIRIPGWRWLFWGLLSLSLSPAGPAHAAGATEGARLMFQLAPVVLHYQPDPDHNDYPWLVGFEYESRTHWSAGVASFRNSFDQPSSYWYAGKRWFLAPAAENLYVKLTGGLLLGYDAPYEDKIPLNRDGVALAVIPAVGYQFQGFNAQFVVLGGAGFMFSLGIDIARWH
jgi:hypothetical protein